MKRITETTENKFLILLSTYSNEENSRIAKLFPEINLIIGADRRKGNISPQIHDNCLITQTTKQGKYQGVLDITLGSIRKWGLNSDEEAANLQNKLGSLNWQLSRLEEKEQRGEKEKKRRKAIKRLKTEKQELNRQLSSVQKTIEEEKRSGTRNDCFTNRFIALAKNLPDDQATRIKVGNLNEAIRDLNRKAKETAVKSPDTSTSSLSYNIAGSEVCGTCHPSQEDFWKKTRHAKAYETLVGKRKNFDLSCLACHLTLNMQNATTANMQQKTLLGYPVELQSVGCETCHGAGKKHSIRPEQFHMVKNPAEKVCLTCHTEEHDNNFEYDRKLQLISCPTD